MCAYQSRIEQLLSATVRKTGDFGSTACNLSEAGIFDKTNFSCLGKSSGFPEVSAVDVQRVLKLIDGEEREEWLPTGENTFSLGGNCYENLYTTRQDGSITGQDNSLDAPLVLALSRNRALIIVMYEKGILYSSVLNAIAEVAGDL